MLFRNRGDGSFEDVAPQLGLDVDGDVQSTVFADFDNDGDRDAILARHLKPSLYLVNDNGRFVDRGQALVKGGELPMLGSSVAAADYNGDGLLDVYISTYAGDFAQRAMNVIRYKSGNKKWITALKPFVAKGDWKTLHSMFEDAAPTNKFFTDRPGPPNVLLRNLGNGEFEVDTESAASRFFRNTYQATWADYDEDGDPDIYCANDFSPNYLFRNNGDGTFTDATSETGTADVGFGMGAGWGDYDGDGRQDLYVANMFSKAGRRVTSFFEEGRENYDPEAVGEGIDPMFRRMAEGNSLFRNLDGKWEKVSGMPPEERWDIQPNGKLPVEEGGWSWGGQFCDFDNDGWLDLYTLSGYYTAPKEAAVAVDL